MQKRNKNIKRLQELAGIVGEEEHNSLEDPNPTDDLVSVNIHIDDDGVLRLQLSTFYHGPENGKIPLLMNNPALQELLMKVVQQQAQAMFRKSVHGVLGIPYGLPENKK